jgi:hypothetical protein
MLCVFRLGCILQQLTNIWHAQYPAREHATDLWSYVCMYLCMYAKAHLPLIWFDLFRILLIHIWSDDL